MLDTYERSEIAYKDDEYVISVNNAFSIKEQLKQRQYKWDSLSLVWKIEGDKDKIDSEKQFLDSISANYSIEEAKNYNVKAMGTIIAGKGSFEYRDILKAHGFHFTKDKTWKKTLPFSEMDREIKELRDNGLTEVKFSKR